MRILHVVTLVSPDGAFGGPVRVAENQTGQLRRRGHQVLVAAAHRGYAGTPPADLAGTPLRLFPARRVLPVGFSGLVPVGMRSWLRETMPRTDVVHVHLARDLVTLPAAALARSLGVPYVLQPHGMVVPSGHPLSAPLDRSLTRAVLADAAAVLHLTPEEREGLLGVADGPVALEHLHNGVPTPARTTPLPERVEVLYCARLQRRKRPALFARMARVLLQEGVDARFVMVGPDEGEGEAVRTEIAAWGNEEQLRWEGALPPERVAERLDQASLVVLPSVHEPYPMSVLEAMAAARPVVVTESCGLAPAVRAHGCGAVADETFTGLVDAVRALLVDPVALDAAAGRAARTAREHFGMEPVAARLEGIYERAVARGRRPLAPAAGP